MSVDKGNMASRLAAVEVVRARPPVGGQPWTMRRLQRELRHHDRALLLALLLVAAAAMLALIRNA